MSEPLSRRQLRSIHLAGTVAFPTPYPEIGLLALRPGALAFGTRAGEPVDVLTVEHEQSNRVTVIRTVRLADVAAVQFNRSSPPVHAADGEWYFGPEVAAALERRSNANDPSLMAGTVFVLERAPVLMQVEVGMTAAESAEYYPPVAGERSDAHYDLGLGTHFAFGCDGTSPLAADANGRVAAGVPDGNGVQPSGASERKKAVDRVQRR